MYLLILITDVCLARLICYACIVAKYLYLQLYIFRKSNFPSIYTCIWENPVHAVVKIAISILTEQDTFTQVLILISFGIPERQGSHVSVECEEFTMVQVSKGSQWSVTDY